MPNHDNPADLAFRELPAADFEQAVWVRFRRLQFERSLALGDPAGYHDPRRASRAMALAIVCDELASVLAGYRLAPRWRRWLGVERPVFRLSGLELRLILPDLGHGATLLPGPLREVAMYEADAEALAARLGMPLPVAGAPDPAFERALAGRRRDRHPAAGAPAPR